VCERGGDGEVSVNVGFDGGVLEGPSWAVLETFLSLHVRVPTYLLLAACLQNSNPRHQKASDSTQNSGILDQHWTQTLPSHAHGCSYL